MTALSGDSLGDTLLAWREPPVDLYEPSGNSVLDRIRQILVDLHESPGSDCPADLLPLVRQWLLRPPLGPQRWLPFLRSEPWPSRTDWREAGFDVAELRDRMEIAAKPPRLPFLGPQADLLDDALAGVPAPRPAHEHADPFFEDLLGTSYYTGEAQREAVRALVGLPAGTTLIADLPTGTGKSVLAQVPVLLSPPGGLVLVIVPTIALAMDQADRMATLLLRRDGVRPTLPLAYHGGLPPSTRGAMRRALQSGALPVIFTSPEAATASLRDDLVEAAAAGRLSHVMIDEAHLVSSWGGAFRPAFQLMPALARQLRSAASAAGAEPARMVLASATLTRQVTAFLQEQFGGAEKCRVIAGIHLRGEPRYAMYQAADEEERVARVMEAVRAVPRPFILYTTRPDEAEALAAHLRGQGFQRIGCFTGQTPAARRESLLRDWRENRIDGMVATSAFGVGIDKADVRTVIHATFPESLDRFYQEVGRGGRDGHASVSLMVFTAGDVQQARDLGTTVFIGNELGLERWSAMLRSPQTRRSGNGDIEVDIDALRPSLFAHGLRNRLWNLRTLTLMAASGLIELRSVSGEKTGGPDDEADDLDADSVHTVRIRIANPGHDHPDVFASRTGGVRSTSREASQFGMDLMLATAAGTQPVEAVLTRLYTLAEGGTWAPVAPVCGGCPTHWKERASGTPQRLRPFVSGPTILEPRTETAPMLARLPAAQDRLRVIAFSAGDARDGVLLGSLLGVLTDRLRPHTIVAGPSTGGVASVIRDAARSAPSPVMIDSAVSGRDGAEGEVRIVVWLDSPLNDSAARRMLFSACAMTVLLIDPAVPDPSHPLRALLDTIAHTDVHTALRILTG